MDKYYTPSIEEFFVGFECEYSHEPEVEGWNKIIVELRDFSGHHPFVIDLQGLLYCRVKYLDEEDIKELGFIYKGKSIDVWFEKDGNFDMGAWTSRKCQLHYGLHDNRLFIDMIDVGGIVRVFNGVIKNKSELKKVLSQIGIKNELQLK